MKSSRLRTAALAAVATTVTLTSTMPIALAHAGHGTPTPSGPLAGASPAGLGIGLAGLLVLTGALLLGREGVLGERVRGAAVGTGAALLVAGAALSVLFP